MQEKGGRSSKIVWVELGEVHAVRGQIVGEDDFFIQVKRLNGGVIRVAKSAVLKIEEEVVR